MSIDLIIHSASQLLTLAGPAPRAGEAQGELGLVRDGAVAVEGERVVAVGATSEILARAEPSTRVIDARGRVVLPGFVDAHTHAIFAGDRVDEFDRRLRGATYQELMAAGGGIMSTVRATRAVALTELMAETQARLAAMLAHGTTTAECKTGYGLNTETELEMLGAIMELAGNHKPDLVPTFLPAHAVPAEFSGRAEEYIDLVVTEMLPAAMKRAADWRESPVFVDVFCDEGAFTLEQSRRVLSRAHELGFALKIHVDEFANLGATDLAAELGALSADHLMVTTREQMRKMRAAGVIAVLLPGTTFGLGKHDFADARAFVEEGVPVALGSDLNPGTCWCESMPLIMSIGARYEGLYPAQAIVAATINAAAACGIEDQVGSLEPDKLADILIADTDDYRDLCYKFGANPIATVIKRGRVV